MVPPCLYVTNLFLRNGMLMKRVLMFGALLFVAQAATASMFQNPSSVTCPATPVGVSVDCPQATYRWYKEGQEETALVTEVTLTNTAEFSFAIKSCETTSRPTGSVLCTLALRYTPTANGSHQTSVRLKTNKYGRNFYGLAPLYGTKTYVFTVSGLAPPVEEPETPVEEPETPVGCSPDPENNKYCIKLPL